MEKHSEYGTLRDAEMKSDAVSLETRSGPGAEILRYAPGIQSMTGFGHARREQEGWSLRVTLRSVNHRFLDLRLHMPEGFEVFESSVRQSIRNRVRRGHVDVAVHVEAAGRDGVEVNQQRAKAYLEAAEQLRRQFGIESEPDLMSLFRLPGVVATSGAALALDDGPVQERLRLQLDACVAQALDRLETMRRCEGETLSVVMKDLLGRVDASIEAIGSLAGRVRAAFQRHLHTKLTELLASVPLDPGRLAQESALLAERSDISEELARLRSHVQQFRKVLCEPGEAGKKLDFLLQEMQREANTLLSKTPGIESEGLEITVLALDLKSDIEKLREQAQNVE